jgi:hypothetical protein
VGKEVGTSEVGRGIRISGLVKKLACVGLDELEFALPERRNIHDERGGLPPVLNGKKELRGAVRGIRSAYASQSTQKNGAFYYTGCSSMVGVSVLQRIGYHEVRSVLADKVYQFVLSGGAVREKSIFPPQA